MSILEIQRRREALEKRILAAENIIKNSAVNSARYELKAALLSLQSTAERIKH